MDIPPDQLLAQGAVQREVRSICFGYPVCIECLADASDSRASLGVWGGLIKREHRATLYSYPEVKSWEKWLREVGNTLAEELRTKYAPHVLVHVRVSKRATAMEIGQSADMTKQEYLTAPLSVHSMKQIPDQFGRGGWELVAVVSGPGDSDSLVGCFKRPL